MMKKILIWAGVAFLVFFIAKYPIPAANGTTSIFGIIGDIAVGFATFLGELADKFPK